MTPAQLKFEIFSRADNWAHVSRRCPKRLQRLICDRFDAYVMASFDD